MDSRNQNWSTPGHAVSSNSSDSSYEMAGQAVTDSSALQTGNSTPRHTGTSNAVTPRHTRTATAFYTPTPKGKKSAFLNGSPCLGTITETPPFGASRFGNPLAQASNNGWGQNMTSTRTPMRGDAQVFSPQGQYYQGQNNGSEAQAWQSEASLPTISLADSIPSGFNVIHIERERNLPDADPAHPQFLASFEGISEEDYYRHVMPFLGQLTFILSSVADLNFLYAVLHAPNHPNAWHAVAKVAFPKMYWFSGIAHNRKVNPFLAFLSQLPSVREVSMTFHAAGLTTSVYNERERMRVEKEDLEQSKELKVLRIQDFVKQYDVARIFMSKSVKEVKLYCVESEMVNHYVKDGGDSMVLFGSLVGWMRNGFSDKWGTNVKVEAKVITAE